MPLLPFPVYAPDVVDYQSQSSLTITGVVPRADGYGPVPSPTVYSAALASTCRGAFVAWKDDGSVRIFAGTATKLYILDNTALTWSDVSKGAGTYTSVVPAEQWQFAQFGTQVIAVQANTVPQVYDLTAGGAFARSAAEHHPPRDMSRSLAGSSCCPVSPATPLRVPMVRSSMRRRLGRQGVNSSDFQDCRTAAWCAAWPVASPA